LRSTHTPHPPRPDIDTFAARFEPGWVVPADESIQLGGLPPQLQLEIQYTLQQRRDRRVGKLQPSVVARVVRLLAGSSASSLLDHDEDTWLAIADGTANDSLGRALLLYARRAVADLAETGGWEGEYPRDIRRMHRLGFEGRHTLRFDRIAQPWLRELAKRWVRLRLSSGLGLEAGGGRVVVAIGRFSQFLTTVGVEHIDQLDRQLLERYLADLHREPHPQHRSTHIGLLNGFFTAVRQHRWHPELPATAVFFPADHPRRPDKLPRALAEQVMTQLEQPANLDRPLRQPVLPVDHRHPDALRSPGHRRAAAARRLCQPQDAPRRPGAHRHRTRRRDRAATPTHPRSLVSCATDGHRLRPGLGFLA
jgi:hypothetical protein